VLLPIRDQQLNKSWKAHFSLKKTLFQLLNPKLEQKNQNTLLIVVILKEMKGSEHQIHKRCSKILILFIQVKCKNNLKNIQKDSHRKLLKKSRKLKK